VEKKKNGPSEKVSFQLVLEIMQRDWIVAGSSFHDAGPVTANARSPQLVFECGTWKCFSKSSMKTFEYVQGVICIKIVMGHIF